MFKVPERHRIREGKLGSTKEIGNNGCFHLEVEGRLYKIIASQDLGWEHVSASPIVALGRKQAPPIWSVMCEIKNRFWSKADVVLQYHPAEKDYVNCHPFTLHLWRPMEEKIPTPPNWMV